ncbi:MAG: hypothetical protein IMX02_02810 [Limnochordaceae bacterium]|nr:hypothetical protein [Limnochordaceae bacterium]
MSGPREAQVQTETQEGATRPEVVLDGKAYRLRRLTVTDTFRLVRVLSKSIGAAILSGQVQELRRATPTEVMGFLAGLLLAALPNAEAEVLDLLGSLVGMKGEEFARLPMGSELEVIAALAQVPELPQVVLSLMRLVAGGQVPFGMQQPV